MNLFEFRPEKNVKKLGKVTGLLLVGAAVLMIMTIIIGERLAYRWAIQLLALGMLAMGIFITSRYIMKGYVYAVIKSDDGSNDFTVTEIQGRHTITVCRIGLASVEQAVVVPPGDKELDTDVKNKIKSEKRKLFNYCADLLGEKYICLFVTECGEKTAIKLSWGEELEKLFENNGDGEDEGE